MKFVSIPTEIEAVQFTQNNQEELWKFADNDENILNTVVIDNLGFDLKVWGEKGPYVEIYDTLHNSWIKVYLTQWIIRGTKGEYYPCDDEVFKAKYRPVGEKK